MEEIPFELLYDSVLDIDDGLFLETLINNLRNDVVGYQHFIKKNNKNIREHEGSKTKYFERGFFEQLRSYR